MDSPRVFPRPQRSPRFYHLLLFAAGFVASLLIFSAFFNPAQRGSLSITHAVHRPDHKTVTQPKWLLATMSPAHSQRRRNIIRATWQTTYQDSAFDTRFVISNPTDLWQPLIDHENATYGDLIVLPYLEESSQVANTVKPIEFFKHIANEGRSWNFVSKIDDDSFVDAGTMYREFLQLRIEEEEKTQTLNRTVIARRLNKPYPYPGGQFYTLSWDIVKCVAQLHTAHPIDDEFEDVLIGRLLDEGGVSFDFVELDDTRAFDAAEDLHKVGKATINPHKMKDDDMYLRVASLYDRNGFRSE